MNNNIVEKAYTITKELIEKESVNFTNFKNIECSMAIIKFDKDEEYDEEEYFVTYNDGYHKVQMKMMSQLNPGLLHSFIVGLIRNF